MFRTYHAILHFAFIGIFLLAGCTFSRTGISISVSDRPVKTILQNGNQSDDAELLGKKLVSIDVDAGTNHVTQVFLSFWFAGFNSQGQTIELESNRETRKVFKTELPDSETLDVCEAMYYVWTVSYANAQGETGAYMGSIQRVMPTKTVRNGSIEQALCPEPPPSDQ